MNTEIVFLKQDWENLCKQLGKENEKESFAFLLAKSSKTDTNLRLICNELVYANEEDYKVRSLTRITLKRDFLKKIYLKCCDEQYHPIHIHTHPLAQAGHFSWIDDQNELEVVFPYIDRKIENIWQASIVIGNNSEMLDARIWSSKERKAFPINQIKIIAKDSLNVITPCSVPLAKPIDEEKYSRSILTVGKQAQQLYMGLKVGVIGIGGLGSIVAELLARLPVKEIILCDHDSLEKSNLNRFIGARAKDIGKSKTIVVKRSSRLANPDVKVTTISSGIFSLEAQYQLKQADILFGCVDSIAARYVVNGLSSAHYIPYFDLGSGISLENKKIKTIGGQVISLIPGRNYCLSCTELFSKQQAAIELMSKEEKKRHIDAGYIDGVDEPEPAVYFLNMQIAAMGVWQMMRYVSGLGNVKDIVALDSLNNKIENCLTPENNNCLICSNKGLAGKGDSVPLFENKEANFESFFRSRKP